MSASLGIALTCPTTPLTIGAVNVRGLSHSSPSIKNFFLAFPLLSSLCYSCLRLLGVLLTIQNDRSYCAASVQTKRSDASSKSCPYLVFVIAVVYNFVSKYGGWLSLRDAPSPSSLIVPRLLSEFPFAQSIRMAAEMHFSDLSNLRERSSERCSF